MFEVKALNDDLVHEFNKLTDVADALGVCVPSVWNAIMNEDTQCINYTLYQIKRESSKIDWCDDLFKIIKVNRHKYGGYLWSYSSADENLNMSSEVTNFHSLMDEGHLTQYRIDSGIKARADKPDTKFLIYTNGKNKPIVVFFKNPTVGEWEIAREHFNEIMTTYQLVDVATKHTWFTGNTMSVVYAKVAGGIESKTMQVGKNYYHKKLGKVLRLVKRVKHEN